MFKPVHLLACATSFALTACAMPPGSPFPQLTQSSGPQCFRANQVYGYTPEPNGDVEVRTAQGPFRIQLGPGCPDFSWIMQIGVRPAGDSWLCEGRPDQLITAFETPYSRCWIRGIQALGPPAASRAGSSRLG
jgi:hypothetical protein